MESFLHISVNDPEVCTEECGTAHQGVEKEQKDCGNVLASSCKRVFVSTGTQFEPEGVANLKVNKTVKLKTGSFWCLAEPDLCCFKSGVVVPVVQRADNATNWINRYPADKMYTNQYCVSAG